MPEIQFEVTDINSVDEEIRGAYVEKEGKFRLDVEKYHELKAAPLLKKNQELLNEKKKLAESTKELERKGKSTSDDIEKQLGEKDQRIAQLEKENREFAIWTPVRSLATKHGVLPDRLEAVMTLLRAENRFDMEEKNLVYRDKYGNATAIKPERAFEVYLREELPWAFEASKAGGSGAQNGKGGGGSRTIPREVFDGWTQAQRDKAIADGARIVD